MEYGFQPPIYTPPQSDGLPDNWGSGGGGGSGSSDYNSLTNLPKINNVQVKGEMSLDKLGIASIYAAEVLATMPASPKAKQTVMYVGEDTDDFKAGHIYRFSGTAWVEIYAPKEGEVKTISNEEIDELFI